MEYVYDGVLRKTDPGTDTLFYVTYILDKFLDSISKKAKVKQQQHWRKWVKLAPKLVRIAIMVQKNRKTRLRLYRLIHRSPIVRLAMGLSQAALRQNPASFSNLLSKERPDVERLAHYLLQVSFADKEVARERPKLLVTAALHLALSIRGLDVVCIASSPRD